MRFQKILSAFTLIVVLTVPAFGGIMSDPSPTLPPDPPPPPAASSTSEEATTDTSIPPEIISDIVGVIVSYLT